MLKQKKSILLISNSHDKFNSKYFNVIIISKVSVNSFFNNYLFDEIDAILFDFRKNDDELLKLIYELKIKIIMQGKLIPFIAMVLNARNKENMKNLYLSGIDKVIHFPFKEEYLKRIISEVNNIYRDIFVDIQVRNFISFKILDDFKYLDTVNKIILRILYYTKINHTELFKIKFALYEIGVNALKYKNRPNIPVSITVSFFNDKIVFKVKDFGQGFDISLLKSFLDDKYMDKLTDIKDAHGLGIFFANKIMDRIIYNSKGNEVILEKYL